MPDNGSRLDRIEAILELIGERHAALEETVELLAGMQRENEDRFARNEDRLAQLMDAMNRLIRVVETHERRLDDLEGA